MATIDDPARQLRQPETPDSERPDESEAPGSERAVESRDDIITRLLDRPGRIAVVGLSDRPWRASHQVAAHLQRQGWEIVPVNPTIEAALGVPAVASLAEAGPVDLVDVFRRSEHLPDVAEQAAAAGAPALWNQLGLRSERAAAIAAEAGMDYVEDRCVKVELLRRT